MKNIALLFALLFALQTMAQTVFQTDTLKIGRGATLLSKELIFDSGDGGSNKKLSLDPNDNQFDLNSTLNITGAMSASGAVSAGGAISTTSGNISTASGAISASGNITSTAGNITASGGNLSASGTLNADGNSTLKGNITIGAGSNVDRTITMDKGGSNPYIQWDSVKQKWVFSNDSVIEKPFGSGSGGGGSGQTFNLNGNLEDGISTNHSFTVGVATSLAGASALEGDVSALIDFTAQNDFYRSDYFTVPPGLYGMACQFRFKYSGGDTNIYAVVENQAGTGSWPFRNNALAGANGLPSHTIRGYESIYFPCPTAADVLANAQNAQIRFRIYQGTVTNAAAMSADLFSLGELINQTETTLPDVSWASVDQNGLVSSDDSDFINGNCTRGGATPFAFTCSFNSGYFSQAPVCTISTVKTTAVSVEHTSKIITLNNSNIQVVTFTDNLNGAGWGADNSVGFNISCSKTGADRRQTVQVYKSIPRVSDNFNYFSARVSSTGVVTSLSVPGWVSNCTVTNQVDHQRYVCPITGFTDKLNCSSTRDTPSGTTTIVHYGQSQSSSTEAIFRSQLTTANTAAAQDFVIDCQRQGADVKMPIEQPIIVGQVTNSAAEGTAITNIRTEGCRIANNGAASLSGTSGLCSTWVQSVSRTSLGNVDVTFVPGIFSSEPICSAMSFASSGETAIGASYSSSVVSIRTNTSAGAASDIPFLIQCKGRR